MTQYPVQDPQGNNHIIEGPDGASDEEVIAQAQKLFGQSGGMTQDSGLAKIRSYITNNPIQRPNPVQGFDQDVNQAPQSTDPFGQRLLENAGVAAGGYGLGSLAGSVGFGMGNKVSSLLDTIKTAKAAEAAGPVESALSAGLNAKDALGSELATAKATKDALYAKIPADLKVPLTTAQNTADTIINEIKELPPSYQSSKISSMVKDLQNLDSAKLGTVQAMRSTLSDIANNGEGVEKLYAGRLVTAINNDLDTLGKSSVLNKAISQGPSLEAQDLRRLWADTASKTQQQVDLEDITRSGAYVNPANIQGQGTALTNIPQNLKSANSFYKDLSSIQQHPVTRGLNRARPEEMSDVIFKRGNVDDVNVGKAVLGPTGYNSVKNQFYKQLLDSKNLGNTLAKYEPDFLQAAIGDHAVKGLQALAQFKALISKAVLGGKIAAGAVGAGTAYEVGRKLIQ